MKNSLLVAAAVSVILASCASTPKSPEGSVAVRSKLTALQSDVNLSKRSPVALQEAEAAVKLAETPQKNAKETAHLVYLADHKVDTARALAEVKLAEDQRTALQQQNESSRLQSRTREADAATAAAAAANAAATAARADADSARADTNAVRNAAAANEASAASAAKMAELQKQIDLLQAKTTERGIVLTLGDVLFETGRSDLRPGATGNLDRLVSFMAMYPERTAVIEGHTDSVGEDDYNMSLSLRRADTVRSYLNSRGVSSQRLTSFGKGESFPVSGNDSASGRQQNRRVEVIIDNRMAVVVP